MAEKQHDPQIQTFDVAVAVTPEERLNAAILAQCDSPRICSVNGRVKTGIRCGPCERKALEAAFADPLPSPVVPTLAQGDET